jgi:hypothetical protein
VAGAARRGASKHHGEPNHQPLGVGRWLTRLIAHPCPTKTSSHSPRVCVLLVAVWDLVRGLLAEALSDGGGGRTACGRNEVEECLHLRPSADERR